MSRSGFLEQRRVGSAAGRSASMPSLSDYEAWLAEQPRVCIKPTDFTASQYRRIATMKAAGEYFLTIARSLGKSPGGVKNAWDRLPEALR